MNLLSHRAEINGVFTECSWDEGTRIATIPLAAYLRGEIGPGTYIHIFGVTAGKIESMVVKESSGIVDMAVMENLSEPELTDEDLLNWLEQDPCENLQDVEFAFTQGKFATVRDAIRHLMKMTGEVVKSP